MFKKWKQERLIALAGAVLLTIALPIAIDQGYVRYNPYLLPIFGLTACVLYVIFAFTSSPFKNWVQARNVDLGSSHPWIFFILLALIYIAPFVSMVEGFKWALAASEAHVKETLAFDHPVKLPPQPTESITPKTEQREAIVDVPSVDLMIDVQSKAFNFTNHGARNVYLWGDKIGNGEKSIDSPRTLTPSGSYHIYADEVIGEIVQKVTQNGDLKIPFDVYISTQDGKEHILRYSLWAHMRNSDLKIDTQNLGTLDTNFTRN